MISRVLFLEDEYVFLSLKTVHFGEAYIFVLAWGKQGWRSGESNMALWFRSSPYAGATIRKLGY